MHIDRMKTVAKATLDIVVVDTENRHARSTGKSGDGCWVADAVWDIAAMGLCSEARHLVPECGLEVGNFAVVDGTRVVSVRIGLTPMVGKPRYSHLLRTAWMGALMTCCA